MDLPKDPYRSIAKDHLADLYNEFIKSNALENTSAFFKSFCAGEIARVTHGWAGNGDGLEQGSSRFHPGFIRCAIDRRVTRERCMCIMEDLVRTLLHNTVLPLTDCFLWSIDDSC